MLRDVFYYGDKPNVHPREKFATSLEDARSQCTTEHFWIINEYCDYRGFDWDFDFEFLPDEDVWAEEHNNVWPSQHQKDSGTWLCPSKLSEVIIYRNDVDPVRRKNIKNKFWLSTEFVDSNKFDYSWHPDPTEPDYIYEFGTQWHDRGGPRYVPNSITRLSSGEPIGQIKHMSDLMATLVENKTNWDIPSNIDIASFDFSWVPHPDESPYIYQFGTQHQKTGGPKYIVEGATDVKYVNIQKAKALPTVDNWETIDELVISEFDYSWHPDDTDDQFIYVFGNNQYPAEVMPTIQYIPTDATKLASGKAIGQLKYVNDIVATLGENKTNWVIPDNIDVTDFDFSWVPNPHDNGYVYQFGTQHQKTGGPKYVVEGATDVKYVEDIKAKALPTEDNWQVPSNIDKDSFDFSWHPDDTETLYTYVFGTQHQKTGGPKYVVDGSTELKYIDTLIATALPNRANWEVPDTIDIDSFDFSWHPDENESPFIYQFGTQHQKTGGPKYVSPSLAVLKATLRGAFKLSNNDLIKYIDTSIIKSTRLPNKTNWEIPDNIINFDFSWHPDETDDPFIYVFGTQHQPTGGPQYIAEGIPRLASGKPIGQLKYVSDIVATLSENKTNWDIPDNIDVSEFDFSWHPNVNEEPYIYQFGTQHQKTGGPKYIVEGATRIKYVDGSKAKRLPNKDNFEILIDAVISDFDYSWHPDDTETESYTYVFGNNLYSAEVMPTVQYIAASRDPNTQLKYVNDIVAKLGENKTNWDIPDNIDIDSFDFSWIPHPQDIGYVHQFGTQWQKTGGPKYLTKELVELKEKMKGGSKPKIANFELLKVEVKYVDTLKAKILPEMHHWIVPDDIDTSKFDYSWHPDETEVESYIYQFGTQHQKTGGPQYVPPSVPRMASGKPIGQVKYIADVKSKKLPNRKYWSNIKNSDTTFDFSWHPDDTDPPTTYQFGTLLDKENGPRYVHPDTLDDVVVYLERIEKKDDTLEEVFARYTITTTLEELIRQHPNELFWALNPDLDYSDFDFNWRPSIEQSQYLHAFGSQDNINTQTYFVNAAAWLKGYTDINYVEDKTINVKINIDMFFVDRSNSESQLRFEKLKQKFPNIQKTRYLNSWVDTINRCINRASSNLCWILNSELDYSEFDFNYYPNPWQMKMVHVFGTQWSHWGTTFMVNRETFAQDTKYIKIIEHLSTLNFVKDRKAKATNVLYDIVYIDHGNVNPALLQGKTVIKYQDSYIATFQKMLDILPAKKEHYVWIASTVCDYADFDFTYICDPFAKEQLHVFPSDKQKFGDTFLVDVNKLRSLIEDMNVLEDYIKINYNQTQRAKRLPAPIIFTESDTHVSTINSDFNFPYATYITTDNKEIEVVDSEPMSLWTPESKNIQITSTGGTRIVVPKEAKEYVKRELYDYPYITTNARLAKSSPMDIVFLSNGETGAEENYQHLLKVTEGLPNRITRVDGVNGRVAAYHAAAEASNTPWLFTVFAKLKVSNKFDWNWQPDRLQIPKHYVFYATNAVNGLKYGSMAMIAYNKKLTLANQGKGIDFTMDDEHEVLEIHSGIANFNTDEWVTWRTAFREALKLRAENSEVSMNRLNIWLTVGAGKFSEYSMEGAQHAIEYYDEVNGDFEKLKLSYDWPWLRSYFDKKYIK